MKTRLCIGLHHLDNNWVSIMDQLGLCYEEVDYSLDLFRSYSLILLNANTNREEKDLLSAFLNQGGSILEMKGSALFNDKKRVHHHSAATIFNEHVHPAFDHLPLLDLNAPVELHQNGDMFEGLIHFSSQGKGNVGFFGVDLPSLMNDTSYVRKKFYSKAGTSPNEIVSSVSKFELIKALEAVLKELHFQRSLPLLQKWTSPDRKPVFCFRIDSDFGDKYAVSRLYDLVERYAIPATWFLHVEAHEGWLDTFLNFDRQELALHGYKHGTSSSPNKIRTNIKEGLRILERAGIDPQGYCAPYGIWNEALEEALTEFNFSYSSEFTYAYDSSPLFTPHSGTEMQIPVHPICTGSLNTQGYRLDQMGDYFNDIVQCKLARYQPVLMYHHPMQTGLEVWDQVFGLLDQAGMVKLSFNDFKTFWCQRQACTFEAYAVGADIEWSHVSDPKQYIQVSTTHELFRLGTFDMHQMGHAEDLSFLSINAYLPSTEQAKELRKTDLSLIKSSLLDWKNRIRL